MSPYVTPSQEFPDDTKYGPALVDTPWDGTALSSVQSPGEVLLRVLELSIGREEPVLWRSCTGCHELNEGHATGPWDAARGVNVGVGCDECGGAGAVIDER